MSFYIHHIISIRKELGDESMSIDAKEIEKIDKKVKDHSHEMLDFLKSRDVFWVQISNQK